MKKVNTNQNLKIDISFFEDDAKKDLYQYSKGFFKDYQHPKYRINWFELMIYNVIRNKPLFQGLKVLKSENFYAAKYETSRYKEMNDVKFKNLENSYLYLKNIDKTDVNRSYIDYIIEEISKEINNKNNFEEVY